MWSEVAYISLCWIALLGVVALWCAAWEVKDAARREKVSSAAFEHDVLEKCRRHGYLQGYIEASITPRDEQGHFAKATGVRAEAINEVKRLQKEQAKKR